MSTDNRRRRKRQGTGNRNTSGNSRGDKRVREERDRSERPRTGRGMTRQERERQLHRRLAIAAGVLAVLVLAAVLVIRAHTGRSSVPETGVQETAAVQQETAAESAETPAAEEPKASAETEAPAGTEASEKVETPAETEASAETEAAPAETETPAETEAAAPAETEAAAETEASGTAETPAETEAAAEAEASAETEAAAPADTGTSAGNGKSLIENVADDAKEKVDVEKARLDKENAERIKLEEEARKKAEVKTKEELDELSVDDLVEYLRNKEVPEELLQFMYDYPESREFVTNYLFQPEEEPDMDISDEVWLGHYPHFLQWDERWGYKDYGGSFFAVAGCGPTAMSVVYSGLTGKSDMNPYEMGKWAEDMGYYVYGSGTSWEMMWSGAGQLGLGAWEVDFDEDVMLATLKNGYPIIAAMSPGGDFTNFGHFIVLVGVDEDDHIIIRDSNSIVRTERTWTAGELLWQTAAMWAYSYIGG